ncbi:MAG: hypothetical protein C0497_15020 [Gemmatimonas sp.]|nr:hypothetical protein [Gemmatimonas sp.]
MHQCLAGHAMQAHFTSSESPSPPFAAAALAAVTPLSALAQISRPVLAVFAHADDERVVAPLLAKLAREGRETHLVIATDGAKGIRDFAGIPVGTGYSDHRLVGAVMTPSRSARSTPATRRSTAGGDGSGQPRLNRGRAAAPRESRNARSRER